MIKQIIQYHFHELKSISSKIGKILLKSKVLLLNGNLGSGKTTIVKNIVENLGGDFKKASSPTFNLIHIYDINNLNIYHFDLYRIKSVKELINIGIEDAVKNGFVIIEWGEIIENLLDQNYCKINIKSNSNELSRTLVLSY